MYVYKSYKYQIEILTNEEKEEKQKRKNQTSPKIAETHFYLRSSQSRTSIVNKHKSPNNNVNTEHRSLSLILRIYLSLGE